ncbi:MAG TPA: amylo-alpha-1,6-glucosidase [Solirubrobacteraceae bacterium]|jgi:glycogen debranching enzyme
MSGEDRPTVVSEEQAAGPGTASSPTTGSHRRRAPSAARAQAARQRVLSPRGEQFKVIGRAGPVELHGAPSIPAEAREELLVIKDDEIFLCARTDGEIAPAQISGEGFYAYDTRYLSQLKLEVGGARPVALSYSAHENRVLLDCTNATLQRDSLPAVPQLSLSIGRELMIAAGRLYYLVRLRNFLSEAVTTTVSLTLAADFADMFEIRGTPARAARGHALAPKRTARGITLAYLGEDEVFRETVVEFDPEPKRAELDAECVQAFWDVELKPRVHVALLITAEPSVGGRRRARRRVDTAARHLRESEARWDARCTSIESDNELFNELITISAQDLRALRMPTKGGQILAAGIPWYVAPFGRDALVTAGEALLLNTDLTREALRSLAHLQAREDDPWRDAQPGKILHELRVGELAGAGLVPHTPYYGTVDATPLFLMRAADYYAWTGDLETLRALRPALDAALRWIDEYGDLDGDGFVEYERRSAGGLRNQGWKDSEDSIVHADGSLAEGPIALVEVQGYVYAAKYMIADVYDALGLPQVAQRLREEASSLRVAFNEAFWNPQEGTFALALDGRKRQVASVTSNPGHCLYCGIVDADKADAVVERLFAPDMFCGWGVRTLSSECPAYNPMSYHNGSVWPHDNAIIAAGLKRYGHQQAVLQIAACLFEVAVSMRDSRLPELYCGFDRAERPAIVAYPVACIPQAWAAAAPFLIMQAMLGISANAPSLALTIGRPALPDWLGEIRLQGLRVGDASATLLFERDGQTTSFALTEQTGRLNVIMAAGR